MRGVFIVLAIVIPATAGGAVYAHYYHYGNGQREEREFYRDPHGWRAPPSHHCCRWICIQPDYKHGGCLERRYLCNQRCKSH